MRYSSPVRLALMLSLAACRSAEHERHEDVAAPEGAIQPAASQHGLADELKRVQREDEPSAILPDMAGWEIVYAMPFVGTYDALEPSLWRAPDGSHWVVEMGGIDGRGRYCYGPYWLVEDRLFPDPR